MPSVNVREFESFVNTTRQRLLQLERRSSGPAGTPPDFRGQAFSFFKVVKPIKPGESGTGRMVAHHNGVISDPGEPVVYQGWEERGSGELEIHDSAHRTLAMPGDIIIAEYRSAKWRTFCEFGITNIRGRATATVTPTGDPVVPAPVEYQIISGDAKTAQFYNGQPVTINRMTVTPVTINTEALLSYDRTAKEWFVVETGGGTNIAIARCQQNVTHQDDTFDATISMALAGSAPAGQDITVHNLRIGQLAPDDPNPQTYTYPGATTENIFVLIKGQFVIVLEREDGDWQILQSGAVYNSTPLDGGGSDPSDPITP